MRVLVLGGTRFIGRHIVEALVAAGDSVSVFTRGASPDALPAAVERLHGDRSHGANGLTSLGDATWDACVDVSGYTAVQVRASAERLASKVGRYVFISTGSVYQSVAAGPLDESFPLLAEASEDVVQVTNETYGPLKVTCERIVQDAYADRATILRPQIVAGPYDPTGRHTYWVQRSFQPGETLLPGDGSDVVQVVDGRDIARFTRRAIVDGASGCFDMAGPRLTWRAFGDALGITSPVWVDASAFDALGLTFAELPLYLPNGSPQAALMDISAARATAAGFAQTDARTTIADTRAWLRQHPMTPVLTAERERDAITYARARNLAR